MAGETTKPERFFLPPNASYEALVRLCERLSGRTYTPDELQDGWEAFQRMQATFAQARQAADAAAASGSEPAVTPTPPTPEEP